MHLRIVNLSILLLLLISSKSFSQSDGFIMGTDKIRRVGLVKINWRNPKEVQFYKYPDAAPQTIGAEDLIEVRYEDRFFKSLVVRSDEVSKKELAELLVNGEFKLYQTLESKTFFIEGVREGLGGWIWTPRPTEPLTVTQLGEQNFRQEIKGLAHRCDRWDEQHPLVKMRRAPLSSFVTKVNHNKCKNIPFVNFGLSASYNWSTLSLFRQSFVLNRLGDYSIEQESWGVGAFLELPIWMSSGFSFVSQLAFTNRKFNNVGTRGLTVDFDNSIFITQEASISHSSLTFEFGPRYTFNTKNYRPYLTANGVFEYLLNQKDVLVHQIRQTDGSIASRTEYDIIPISNFQYGLSYGAGIQYFYKVDQYVALELKSIAVFDSKITRKIDRMNSTVISFKINL